MQVHARTMYRVHGTRPWLFFTAMQHRWTHDILDYTLRNEERLVGMCSNSKRFSKLNPSSFPERPTSRKAETGEGERVRKAPQQARWLNVCMSVPDKHTSQPRPWKHSRHPNSTFSTLICLGNEGDKLTTTSVHHVINVTSQILTVSPSRCFISCLYRRRLLDFFQIAEQTPHPNNLPGSNY